jgi:Na+/melibiose symporter-like transporter
MTAQETPAVAVGTTSPAPTAPKRYLSIRERLSYNSYWVGQNIVFIIVTSFLAVYFTSTLGIPAAIVGTIMLVARLWDALVDPVLATIVERVNLRRGKFKPWVWAAAVTVPVMTIACFAFQSWLVGSQMWIRILYCAGMYMLWGTVYAASDGPGYALGTVITPEPAERNVLFTFNQVSGLVGILIGIVAFQPIVEKFGNSWFLGIIPFAVLSFLTMLPIRRVKERVSVTNRETPSIGQIWRAIAQNKYLVLTVVMGLLANASNFALTLGPFITQDIYHQADASALLLLQILPILLVAPFGAWLIKKFGKIPLLAFSYIAGAVLSVVAWLFCRDSYSALLIVQALKGLTMAPQLFMFSLMFADSIEWDFHKNGRRFEAATFASQTMMTKAALAISGSVGLWIIGLAGYVSSTSGTATTQTPHALSAEWATYNLGSAVGSILGAIVLLCFYDLTASKLAAIVASNRLRERIEA